MQNLSKYKTFTLQENRLISLLNILSLESQGEMFHLHFEKFINFNYHAQPCLFIRSRRNFYVRKIKKKIPVQSYQV